jgi:hypothetical protein
MMQWLDSFATTKLLAQKSLKIELRLKSYRILKFQGLDCKYKSKTGARLEFIEKPGASV